MLGLHTFAFHRSETDVVCELWYALRRAGFQVRCEVGRGAVAGNSCDAPLRKDGSNQPYYNKVGRCDLIAASPLTAKMVGIEVKVGGSDRAKAEAQTAKYKAALDIDILVHIDNENTINDTVDAVMLMLAPGNAPIPQLTDTLNWKQWCDDRTLDSLVDAVAGKRITYAELTENVD